MHPAVRAEIVNNTVACIGTGICVVTTYQASNSKIDKLERRLGGLKKEMRRGFREMESTSERRLKELKKEMKKNMDQLLDKLDILKEKHFRDGGEHEKRKKNWTCCFARAGGQLQ